MTLINYRYRNLDNYLRKFMELLFKTKFRPLSDLESVFSKLSFDLVDCVVEEPQNVSKYLVDDKEKFYLPYHSINTAVYSINAAYIMGACEDELYDISKGALLHDAGMIEIPKDIFINEQKLNVEELFIIQQHPEYGVSLVKNCDEKVKKIVKFHHESFSGDGYPQGGLWQVDNEYLSSIVSIADAYDAMISYRVYKHTLSTDEAKLSLLELADVKWDKKYVEAFISGLERIA